MNPENIRKQIEDYIAQRLYRLAYEKWLELKELADAGTPVGVDLTALSRDIDRQARNYREMLVDELNTIFAPGKDILQRDLGQSTRDRLDALYDASLPGDDNDHQALKRRFDLLLTEQRHRKNYEETRAIVEGIWDDAKSHMIRDRNVGAQTILDYYTRARDVANSAAEESPGNNLLQELSRQATAERERFAVEEEVMTSGGQTEDFVRVLQYIDRLKEGEAVMVYDNSGAPLGRMKREEARAEVIKNARAYVRGKVGQYGDAAQDALKDLDPREAEKRLEGYDKFIELDEFAVGEDILDSTTRERYNTLRRQTVDGLGKLAESEANALRARIRAEEDIFAAWGLYLNAIRIYAGAFRSADVRAVREDLTESTRSAVKRMLTGAQGLLGARDYARAKASLEKSRSDVQGVINQLRAWDDLHADMRTLLGASVAEIEVERDQIDTLLKQANDGVANKNKIAEDLRIIRDMSASQPQNAADRLAQLVAQYGQELVVDDPQYILVSSRVQTTVNAAGELENLKAFLTDNDIERVRSAREAAQSAAQAATEDYRQRFNELASQLGFKVQMLEAESTLIRDGYDNAIRAFDAIARQPSLGSELKVQVDARLEQLRADSNTAAINETLLGQIDQDLKTIASNSSMVEDRLVNIWGKLNRMDKFINPTQRMRWTELFQQSLELVKIETRFDRTAFDELLALARGHDLRLAESAGRRMQKYIQAQIARDEERKNMLDKALDTWNVAIRQELFGGEDLSYAAAQVTSIEKRLMNGHQENLKRQLAQLQIGQEATELFADTQKYITEMRQRSTLSSQSQDRLDYLTWAAELELAYALHHTDPETRHKTLASVAQSATQLEQELSNYRTELRSAGNRSDWSKTSSSNSDNGGDRAVTNAEKILKCIKIAPKVSTALRNIELYLKESADVTLFGEAVDEWRGIFSQDTDVTRGYGPLQRWYETQVNNIRKGLKERFAQEPDTSTAYLQMGTRLLLLDPNDDQGRALKNRLKNMSVPLGNQFSSLINALPNGGSTGLISDQLDKLHDHRSYLRLVGEILGRFPAMLGESETTTLLRVVNKQEDTLTQVIEQFQRFKSLFDTYTSGIKAYELNIDNWSTAEEDLKSRLSKLKDDVRSLGKALGIQLRAVKDQHNGMALDPFDKLEQNHPAMAIAKDDCEEMQSWVRRVVRVYSQLEKAAGEDDFELAKTIMINAENGDFRDQDVRRLLERSSLPDDFNIISSQGRDEIRGWDEIKIFVTDRALRLNRIITWAESAGETIGWDNIKDPSIGAKYQDMPYDYEVQMYMVGLYESKRQDEAVYYQTLALIASGKFTSARALLEQALKGDRSALGGRLSLNAAVEHYSHYPLADHENHSVTNFENALESAGSKAGQDRLLEVLNEILPAHKKAQSEAQSLLNSLVKREEEWEQLKKKAADLVNALSNQLETLIGVRGMVGRASKLATLREQVAGYERNLREMRERFPHHPQISGYEQATIFKNAYQTVQGG